MFELRHRNGVSFFVFSQLEGIPRLVHAFSSRQTDAAFKDAEGPHRVALEKPQLLNALDLDRVEQLEQTHSDTVLTLEEASDRARGDGLIVTQAGRFAAVRSADCALILVVDPRGRRFCLIHAGWRGNAQRIVEKGVRRFLNLSRADPNGLIAALGPCIRSCCYEVGAEVRREFERGGFPGEKLFRGSHLDLAACSRLQLERSGVGKVLDSGLCTSCRPDLFYSWRRARDRGRMWALAGFRAA